MRFAAILACTALATNGVVDIAGKPLDPFSTQARARVLLFVRTDCPITNRYAPEMQRIADEFTRRGVEFWLVYPDPAETAAAIQTQIAQYRLPGRALRDPAHFLVRRAEATIAPQAAVFDSRGQLVYSGRIDDLYVDFGKSRPTARTHDLENAITALLAGQPVAAARTHAVGCYLADVK